MIIDTKLDIPTQLIKGSHQETITVWNGANKTRDDDQLFLECEEIEQLYENSLSLS